MHNRAPTWIRLHVPGSQYVDESVATYTDATGRWEYYLLGRQHNVVGHGNADGSVIEAVDYSSGGSFKGSAPTRSRFDFDHDGDVDAADRLELQACFTESGAGAPDLGCEDKDLDHDSDVDSADLQLFRVCSRGSYMPIPASCLGGEAPATDSLAMHGRPMDVLPDGHTLLYVRARHYAPDLGRWLQRDPLGYVDGPNLYEAFGGNPLVYTDPMGTDVWEELQALIDRYLTADGTMDQIAERVGARQEPNPYRRIVHEEIERRRDVIAEKGEPIIARIDGIGKVVGGTVEAATGGVIIVESAAIATPAGVVFVFHGVDTAQSGVRQLWYGCFVPTETYRAIAEAGYPTLAFAVDTGISTTSAVCAAGLSTSGQLTTLARMAPSTPLTPVVAVDGRLVLSSEAGASSARVFTATNDFAKIVESGRVWGQTEGSVYGMRVADVPFWRSWRRLPRRDPGVIIFEGEAAGLFRPHPVEGCYSGLKRLLGQEKAPFGDIVFNRETAAVEGNTLVIRNAQIGSHAGQTDAAARARLWGRRLIIEPVCASPAAAAGWRVYETISDE